MPSIWLVVGFFVLFCLCMWRKRTQPAFFLDIGIQSSITTCWGLVYSAPNYKKLKPNIWSFPNTFISFLAFSYILLFPVASLFIFLYFPYLIEILWLPQFSYTCTIVYNKYFYDIVDRLKIKKKEVHVRSYIYLHLKNDD